MAVAIESFECTETMSEPIEACEEAVGLIDTLGLAGQQQLIQRPDEGHATRNPYRKIRADERFVYKTLCPQENKLEAYDASPIPLRILQIASHAQSLEQFKQLYVWHQLETVEKDPVLIAATGGQYEWDRGDEFILARWGEELESFPVLLKRACDKVRHALTQQAEKLVVTVASATDDELVDKGPNTQVAW